MGKEFHHKVYELGLAVGALGLERMDGVNIQLYGVGEKLVVDDTFRDISSTEIIAILDDLVNRNILSFKPSSRGSNTIYSLIVWLFML